MSDAPTVDVAASAPIVGLLERVEQARQAATIDWSLQLGEHEVVLRYKAVDFDTIEKITGKSQQQRGRVGVEQAARLIARACIGIWVWVDGVLVAIDGIADPEAASAVIDRDGTVHGTPLTFASDRIAETFGVATAADAVQALFPLELSIPEHARVILDFSSGKDEQTIRSALGN